MMSNMDVASGVAERDEQPAAEVIMNMKPARRVGVLVMGMHRSGSSAITRVLNLLGCALPLTLMPPAHDNPEGYWESQRLADFNDEILALAGTRWDDWLPVNAHFAETLIWPQLVARGREALRAEFGDAPLFVLKDPRNCKLGTYWPEVLAAEGIDAVFVVPLRNPIEVARSLATRNGIDEHQCLLVWLRHVLAAEAATRGKPRVFTEFTTLLNNWEALAARMAVQLGVIWPRLSPLSAAEIAQFLNPHMRHQISEATELSENLAISPWVRDAYKVLLGWARNGEESADYATLDVISHAFDEAGIAFARPMFKAGQSQQLAIHLEAARVALVEERDSLVERIGEAEGDFERVVTERDLLIVGREALALEHVELSEARHKLAWRLGEVEAEIAGVSALAAGLEENLANASASIDELKYRNAVAESTLHQREEEISQIGAELNDNKAELAKHDAAAATARDDANRLAAALSGAEDRAAHVQAEKDILERQLRDRAAELAELTETVRKGDNEKAAIKAELIQTNARLDNRFAEIAQLSRIYREQEQQASDHRQQAEWLQQIYAVTHTAPRWWSFMPKGWRNHRELERLRRKGLFDGQAYLVRNPDVAVGEMNPLRHYIMHGLNERRKRQ